MISPLLLILKKSNYEKVLFHEILILTDMDSKPFSELNNEELVELAGRNVIGTPSGLSSQLAHAELIRRNTQALIESSKSADRYADKMMGLSLIVGLIALLQLMFEILSSTTPLYLRIVYAFGALALIAFSFKDYFGDKSGTGSKES